MKLECLHRAACRTISGCLSSSPVPLLFSQASLPLLQVTLTHFALSSCEHALHLPTSFSISGLARLENETKTLQIFLESFGVHSLAHTFFYFFLEKLFLLPTLSSLEPAFTVKSTLPDAPALIPLCLAKV